MCAPVNAIFIKKSSASLSEASAIFKNTTGVRSVHQKLNGGKEGGRFWVIIKKSNSDDLAGGWYIFIPCNSSCSLYLYYIAKSIHSPFEIIEFRC